jgi:alpha/beta hydrolase fold
VHWPLRAAAAPAPALVVLFADTAPAVGNPLVERLVEGFGVVVLAVSAAHAIEAHATVAWAADHAAELGADPRRLVLVGDGFGAALAERVAELAVDEGWPPLHHVAMVWPHDDPTAALDELAYALAEPPEAPHPPARSA